MLRLTRMWGRGVASRNEMTMTFGRQITQSLSGRITAGALQAPRRVPEVRESWLLKIHRGRRKWRFIGAQLGVLQFLLPTAPGVWREGRRHWWERLSIPWTRSLKDWSRFFREDLDLVGGGGSIVPPFSLSPIIDLSAHRRKACLLRGRGCGLWEPWRGFQGLWLRTVRSMTGQLWHKTVGNMAKCVQGLWWRTVGVWQGMSYQWERWNF